LWHCYLDPECHHPNPKPESVHTVKAEYPVVAFKSATGTRRGNSHGHTKVRTEEATKAQLQGADCIGGEQLVQVNPKP